MTASSDPFELVGTVVDGRYRIDAVAGHGGQAVVYRAFHLSFEATVALKVLRLSLQLSSHQTKAKVAEFRREGRILFGLAKLHPAIVRAFETGVVTLSNGTMAPYLALEWLDGLSLDQEIAYRRTWKRAPLSLTEVIELLDGPARALSLAHAQGLAHRDIKPQNLFAVTRSGRAEVKILDFGISKWLDISASTTGLFAETGAPRSSFTPLYGAPEQWLPRLGATGPWTDVHAWALVCSELLTGQPPLEGREPAQFMAGCLDGSFRPAPRAMGVEVGDEVEAVFLRALAVEPRDRYRNLGDFWTSLCRAARWSKEESSGGVVLQAAWHLAASRRAFPVPEGAAPPLVLPLEPEAAVVEPPGRAWSGTRMRFTRADAVDASMRTSSTGADRESRIKGVAFRTLDLCFARLRGAEAQNRARGFMPKDLADAFQYRTLLAASWYPVSWYRDTLSAFRAITGEGPELSRELGRLTARHDMASVYKQILARLISPEALLAMSQRVFKTYYDTGNCEIVESHSGFANVRCTSCFGWDHNVWMEFVGSCESLVKIAGGGNTRVRLLSGGKDSDADIQFQVNWSQ